MNSSHDQFVGDDVTNDHTGICFDLGSSYGVANHTLIAYDRIHACGTLPPSNHEHGIYVQDAAFTRIEWNLIYDNADRGIQLYPNAQHTTIDHNVIANNGENMDFSGDGGIASNHAKVYANILAYSQVGYDVSSYYPPGNPVGTGNVLRRNCIWGGKQGTINRSDPGFRARHNVIVDPQFVNPAGFDYHLRSTSRCLPMTGNIASAVVRADMAVSSAGGG